MQHRGDAGSAPIRVGILADTIERPGGIGRYTSELVAAFGRRDDVRLIVAAPPSATELVRELAGPGLHASVDIPTRSQMGIALWERYRSGPELVKAGSEIIHGTKHLVPRIGNVPTVLTVHDLMTITRAHESSLPKRLFLPRQYRASLEQSTGLIAASQATRDRLIEIDPTWEAKTVVAPNGLSVSLVDVEPAPVPDLVDSRFALVVGDLAPRKNVGMLLGIWEQVARATEGFRLVVLGNPGPHSEETTRRLAELEAQGSAIWLRGAPDEALRWCYEHATVVLFPTLEEGFGFPLLEALTFGAPVIASTDPALVEVSAGAEQVIHLDATDPEAWLRAITNAATGVRRPAVFPRPPQGAVTWDENAQTVVSLYCALLHLS
jgi:glycosyltransferase involved in cell wall biosynthesis